MLVPQRVTQRPDLQRIGKRGRVDPSAAVGQQVGFAQGQQVRLRLLRLLPPLLERPPVDDVLRHTVGEELVQRLLAEHQFGPPALRSRLLQPSQQRRVSLLKLAARDVLTGRQPFPQEQLAGGHRVDLGQPNPPLRHHRQPPQRDLLVDHRRVVAGRVVRVEVLRLDQMLRQRLDPLRLDRPARPGVPPRRLDQFRRDDPLRLGPHQLRARPEEEPQLVRGLVLLLVDQHADAREHSGEHRPMDTAGPVVAVDRGPRVPLQFGRQLAQLPVHVEPLLHPGRREEVVGQGLAEPVPRQVLSHLVDERPHREQRQKVAPLGDELPVLLVGRLLLLDRPVAGVADLERRRDDQHIGQHTLVAAGDQHPPDPRIDRHAGQLLAGRGEPFGLVDRPELVQRAVAGRDRRWPRRVDERERLDPPQPQ